MPPDTPRRTRGRPFIAGSGRRRRASVEGGDGLLFLFHFVGGALFGGRLENAALFTVIPADLVLLEFFGGEAGRLERPFVLDLVPRAPDQLLGAARDQEHQTELAVHTFGNVLDHRVEPLSAEFAENAIEARLLPGIG